MRNQYHQFPASAGIFICVALIVGPATVGAVARLDWVMSPSDGGPVYEKPRQVPGLELAGIFSYMILSVSSLPNALAAD